MKNMIRVNLRNWREEEREKRKTKFFLLLAGAAIASVLCSFIFPTSYYGYLKQNQKERNDFLQENIKIAEKKIGEINELKETRKNLLQRMKVIENLQHSRSYIVHYFQELSNITPDGIYLNSIKQQEGKSILKGVADSNTSISQYMVNLKQSEWFKEPDLVVIERNKKDDSIQFELSVSNDPVDVE